MDSTVIRIAAVAAPAAQGPVRRPVRPHDPRDRIVVEQLGGGWEGRAFDPAGPFHVYFLGRGLLHVQLWHAARGISVLTPSRLTAQRWEAWPLRGWQQAVRDYPRLVAAVAAEHAVALPAEDAVSALIAAWAAEPEACVAARHRLCALH